MEAHSSPPPLRGRSEARVFARVRVGVLLSSASAVERKSLSFRRKSAAQLPLRKGAANQAMGLATYSGTRRPTERRYVAIAPITVCTAGRAVMRSRQRRRRGVAAVIGAPMRSPKN